MQFDQRIRDGETETRPLHSIDHHRARLFEWPTQPHKVFRRYSRAIILDNEMDKLRAHGGADRDFAALGREPRIEFIEMPGLIRDKYQYFTEAPMERLRAAGYAGEITPLKAGIGDYVARYLSQSDPYR